MPLMRRASATFFERRPVFEKPEVLEDDPYVASDRGYGGFFQMGSLTTLQS